MSAFLFPRVVASALVLLVSFAAGETIDWPLDGDLRASHGPSFVTDAAHAQWTKGPEGKALSVSEKSPASAPVVAAQVEQGALSFYYRPPGGARSIEILRLGEYQLLLQNGQFLWQPGAAKAGKPWSAAKWASDGNFVLVEIGWEPGQAALVFINGLLLTRMDPPAEAHAPPSPQLTLLNGTFARVRLESDPALSGTRYKGVLVLETFDEGKFNAVYEAHNHDTGARIVPGFDGSSGAIATPVKDGRYFSIWLPLGYFRVTEDTYLCGAWYSTSGEMNRSFVRILPLPAQNHFLHEKLTKDQWTVLRTPVMRFGVEAGWIVNGLALGSSKPGERWLAADEVCIFRGAKKSAPTTVTSLSVAEKDGNAVVTWGTAHDEVGISSYQVFWSNVREMDGRESELIAQTLTRSFTHELIPHAGEWWYSVAAIDAFGNRGPLAPPVRVMIGK